MSTTVLLPSQRCQMSAALWLRQCALFVALSYSRNSSLSCRTITFLRFGAKEERGVSVFILASSLARNDELGSGQHSQVDRSTKGKIDATASAASPRVPARIGARPTAFPSVARACSGCSRAAKALASNPSDPLPGDNTLGLHCAPAL